MNKRVKLAIINMIIAMISFVIAFFMSLPAHAAPQNTISKCVSDVHINAYKNSALYGGAILGVGSALGLAISPAAIPIGTAVAVVGLNTLTGALVGAGSSAVTRISDRNFLELNPVTAGCVVKVGKDAAADLEATVNKAWDSVKGRF